MCKLYYYVVVVVVNVLRENVKAKQHYLKNFNLDY